MLTCLEEDWRSQMAFNASLAMEMRDFSSAADFSLSICHPEQLTADVISGEHYLLGMTNTVGEVGGHPLQHI